MGHSNDATAVIDSRTRVYGVTGLRVVDSSAFPVLAPGHLKSTVYALAENIAAVVLGGGGISGYDMADYEDAAEMRRAGSGDGSGTVLASGAGMLGMKG
ncbi:hypothetical protein MMC21_007014 [Puttea exsequens]|nr:hypothetical protein [Puttea exsequens]